MRMPTVDQLALSVIMFTLLLTGGVLSPHAATAATYYVATNGVDSNPGTQSQPFRTIVKGVSSLHAGDTLYIRQGTYNEQIGYPNPYPPSGTSWSNATTIAGYPGEAVTIKPSGFGVVIFGAGAGLSYIILDNLIIDGLDTGTPCVSGNSSVHFGDNHHIRLQNSEVRNAPNNNISGGNFIEVLNSRVHDACFYGFYMSGHNNLFDGNTVYNNGGFGYHIFHFGASDVNDNVLRNNIIYGNGFGALAQANHSGTDNAVIMANGSNNAFYNNIVYGNSHGVTLAYSFGTNLQAYNNTIYNNYTGITIHTSDTGTTNQVYVKNNIVYGNRDSNINDTVNDPSHITFGPNVCDRSGLGCSVVGDPQFVNASNNDFHLKSSSLALHASDTGGEVGAYTNGGGPGSGGGKVTLPAPKNLKTISVAP